MGEWDDDFASAIHDIVIPVIGDPPDEKGISPQWDLLDDFAQEFYMEFMCVLLEELNKRILNWLLEWNSDENDHDSWLPDNALEQVTKMAHDLYLPAQAGREYLKDFMVAGLKEMYNIDDEGDDS